MNLNSNDFIAKDTKIKIHKNIFNDPENDPRLYGVSSIKKGHKTIVNKGVFTSCKESDKCPPWVIQAEKVVHDQNKQQLLYEHALVKLYDLPFSISQNSSSRPNSCKTKWVFKASN